LDPALRTRMITRTVIPVPRCSRLPSTASHIKIQRKFLDISVLGEMMALMMMQGALRAGAGGVR